MPEHYSITGLVILPDGADCAGLRVQAFDRDLPSVERRQDYKPSQLGEDAATNADGYFTIAYTFEQFQRGEGISRAKKKNADISFRVFDINEQELKVEHIQLGDEKSIKAAGAEPIIYNAPNKLEYIRLFVLAPPPPSDSEYERLIALIQPVIETLPLAELSDDDVDFLMNEVDTDQKEATRQHLQWLRRSAFLARQAQMPVEAFYGWGRENKPAYFEDLVKRPLGDLSSVLSELSALGEETLQAALRKASDEKIIPAAFRDGLALALAPIQAALQPADDTPPAPLPRFSGRLLDEQTGIALGDYTIQAALLAPQDQPDAADSVDLGKVRSGPDGRFDIVNARLGDVPGGEDHHLRLGVVVTDPEGKERINTEIPVEINAEPLIIWVPRLVDPPATQTRIADLSEAGGPEIPAGLAERLAQNEMLTLEDVRLKGGAAKLEGLPEAELPAARLLDAHADLARLSPDIRANAQLIEKGYDRSLKIADTQQDVFFADTRESLGDAGAAALHASALAERKVLGNILTDARMRWDRPWARDEPDFPIQIPEPTRCSCEDCETAAGPLAYLVDLADYAIDHVRSGANPITLDWLETTFHQPFGDLPISCQSMDAMLCQVRLCVEVLRQQLAGQALSPAASSRLQGGEKAYRQAAYQAILERLGTSYEALRLVDDRKALAEQLGFDLDTPQPDRLDALLLDPDKFTEADLERLFGLVDTRTSRDRLSDGLVLEDAQGQVTRWDLQHIEWRRNTDDEGLIHVVLRKQPSGVVQVELYRSADRSAPMLVAAGERKDAAGPVTLAQKNESGLSGRLVIQYSADNATIALAAVPRLLAWRLEKLRGVWEEQDGASVGGQKPQPILDPDLVRQYDLRDPLSGPAADLWQARRKEVDDRLKDLRNARLAAAAPADGLEAELLFADSLGKTTAELMKLADDQNGGEDIRPQLASLALTQTAFDVLVRVARLVTAAPPKTVLDSEWADVEAILAQVYKAHQADSWQADEAAKHITLSPDFFLLPQQPPLQFPPAEPDPLPQWLATAQARRAWEQTLKTRVEQQQAIIAGMQQVVADAEEATIISLRDALIAATGVSLDPALAAKLLTDRLLIDCANGACQKTTRIAHAIETLQGLLFSIYTDQLRDTYPDLSLVAPDFEREWVWIGSYAAWRSAMLVFILPENIDHPSLRDRQSPGFKRLVSDIRTLPEVTPEKACQLAKSYAAYFKDIVLLNVEASARAVTRVYRGTGCRDRNPVIDRPVLHLFGRNPDGHTVYWSMFDENSDPNADHQSFWDWVPGLEAETVNQIIGATSYQLVNGTRFLYVFVKAFRQGSYALLFSRYNLQTGAWESGATALDLPRRGQDFDAILLLQDESRPPRLALRHPSGGGPGSVIYQRSLNPDGNNWADGDWFPLLFSRWYRIGGLKAQPGTKVAAASPEPERLEIFAVGEDGGVYRNWWNPPENMGNWRDNWERVDAGFSVPSGSPVTVGASKYSAELFVIGGDNQVWTRSGQIQTNQIDWQPWYKPLPPPNPPLEQRSEISIVYKSGGISFLFVLDSDGALKAATRNFSPVFSSWFTAGFQDDYRFPHPVPVPAMEVLYGTVGTLLIDWNGQLQVAQTYNPSATNDWGEWGKWTDHQFPLGTPVTSIARRPTLNRIDVFVVDRDGSIQWIWTEKPPALGYYDPWVSAKDWARIGGLNVPTRSRVTALPRGPEHIDLFVTGKDGRVYSAWWDIGVNEGEWNDWFPISAPDETFPLRAPITALERRPNHMDLFVVGNDGGIYSAWWDVYPDAQWPKAPAVELPKLAYKPKIVPPVLPFYQVPTDPYDITEQLSEGDLQNRRIEIHKYYEDNLPGNITTPWKQRNQRRNVDYLDESYYFVPMLLGLYLQRDRHYPAALDWYRNVYDYSMPLAKREIAYLLRLNNDWKDAYNRAADWLLDPLNPHRISETRPRAYARYTILTLAKCFLEAGDEEYTQDTNESVPRARTYYLTALELLDTPDLHQHPDSCDVLTGEVQLELGGYWERVWRRYQQRLADLGSRHAIEMAVPKLQALQAEDSAPQAKLMKAQSIVQDAEAAASAEGEGMASHPTLSGALSEAKTLESQAYSALLSVPEVEQSARQAAQSAGSQVLAGAAAAANLSVSELRQQRPAQPWLSGVREDIPQPLHLGQNGNGNGNGHGHESVFEIPWYQFDKVAKPEEVYVPGPSYAFCVPPNPVLAALRLHAELNLYKLRTCRNISGMERQLDPYTAPTDAASGLPSVSADRQLVLPGLSGLRPTPYHYSTLIERAKQLAQMAAQFEGSMLAAIEKRDAEAYTALKARQDTELMRSQVRLQDLRVIESEGGVRLAELQFDKAQVSLDHWQELLQAGISSLERGSIDALRAAAMLYGEAAVTSFIAAGTPSADSVLSFGSSNESSTAQALSFLGQVSSTASQIMGLQASYERRREEWQYNRQLAQADVNIASQSVTIANDHLAVTREEREIASMQADHAAAVVEFLTNKFTNTELYDWMSNIYEGVYRWFLQQATATARLAATQLGFERQEVPPPFIQADYWEPPADSGSGQPADRRGLTGSARLLQDIYQLDQHAFLKNTRKLHLTKTISLGLAAPLEMQSFRQTGVLRFTTPMAWFDRDFPGHYLRLIKSVRTSVVALVPPVLGIRATLVCNGASRAVVGGGSEPLQTVIVRRDPQMVALSSALNDSGVFELDPQPELLMPFEGLGVETDWEFRMPPASNPIDYSAIADVLVTIQYTALYSYDYEVQVTREIGRNATYERAISFYRDLYDGWCDLHNPDQTSNPPMTVIFKTTRADFLPNLTNLKIKYVTLSFAFAPGEETNIQVEELSLASSGAAPAGGSGTTVKGMLTTRPDLPGFSAALAAKLNGQPPIGDWKLALQDTPQVRSLFSEDKIKDIQLVITYEGETPA